MFMALVHAENGVVNTEPLWPKFSPCNDTLFTLEVLVHDGAALQKVDVLWPLEFCTPRNRRSNENVGLPPPNKAAVTEVWRLRSKLDVITFFFF